MSLPISIFNVFSSSAWVKSHRLPLSAAVLGAAIGVTVGGNFAVAPEFGDQAAMLADVSPLEHRIMVDTFISNPDLLASRIE